MDQAGERADTPMVLVWRNRFRPNRIMVMIIMSQFLAFQEAGRESRARPTSRGAWQDESLGRAPTQRRVGPLSKPYPSSLVGS